MMTVASARYTAFHWFALIKGDHGPILCGPHDNRETSEDVAASYPGETLAIKRVTITEGEFDQ